MSLSQSFPLHCNPAHTLSIEREREREADRSDGCGGSESYRTGVMGSRASTLTLRAALAAAGVAAAAVALHLAAPGIVSFLAAEVPRLYVSLRSWLTPPYLYFVINGIIITIAASSHFQKAAPPPLDATATTDPAPESISVMRPEFVVAPAEFVAKVEEGVAVPPEFLDPATDYRAEDVVTAKSEYDAHVEQEPEKLEPTEAEEEEEEEEEFVISRSSWSPKRRVSQAAYSAPSVAPPEKPLVTARFGHHQQQRRSVKASPEARGLRVARPKQRETLESTWKAITDGRAVPLARHLKKSDTWAEVNGRGGRRDGDDAAAPMRKSETFNDRAARPPVGASPLAGGGGGGKLKRDPSLGQDELNRRVEAFIKKFNDEMRLQRQESFQHYLDMINSGAH